MKPCEIASAMALLAVAMSLTSMVLIGIQQMKKHD